MALFPLSGVLRGLLPAADAKSVSARALVRPCSTKKLLISALETVVCAHRYAKLGLDTCYLVVTKTIVSIG